MERYVAFLRGMNLGGRRIKNEELRKEFEALGLLEVSTFRASGNVLFGAERGESERALTETIEAGLGEALGYDVPVFLREGGRELYWLPSGGVSDSDLDLRAIDAALDLGTMRTMGTIEQIAAKL